jgi:hypothetical protein
MAVNVAMAMSSGSHAPWTSLVRFAATNSRSKANSARVKRRPVVEDNSRRVTLSPDPSTAADEATTVTSARLQGAMTTLDDTKELADDG